jgi:predicted dehydrogenase
MITAIIVGAGHRAMTYAAYAKANPDKLKIVGVADPIELRREMVAKEYWLTPDQCFGSAEELAANGKIADAVINGTMDRQHVPTTLPLLKAGYDVLLEKPSHAQLSRIQSMGILSGFALTNQWKKTGL